MSKLLFSLPPETAHDFIKNISRLTPAFLFSLGKNRPDTCLRTQIGSLSLPHPIGLAAGFDKTGELVDFLTHLGFSFLELGSVTAQKCEGNPKPRIFRLTQDHSLINRMGLPGPGALDFAETLKRKKTALEKQKSLLSIWINIAKTPEFAGGPRSLEKGIEDYIFSFKKLAPLTDVITLNLSCPNSGDGKFFEDPELLKPLLSAVAHERKKIDKPSLLFAKLSPDTTLKKLNTTIELLLKYHIDGLVLTNTSTSRQGLKTNAQKIKKIGAGGLSGAAITQKSCAVLKNARQIVGKNYPLIGCGGIMNLDDVLDRLSAGANALQVYTGFVYGGPSFVWNLIQNLEKIMKKNKIANLEELKNFHCGHL